jgi:hypothetical protein
MARRWGVIRQPRERRRFARLAGDAGGAGPASRTGAVLRLGLHGDQREAEVLLEFTDAPQLVCPAPVGQPAEGPARPASP